MKRFRIDFSSDCGRAIDLATATFAGNALPVPLVTMVKSNFGYKLRMVAEGCKRKLLNEQIIFNWSVAVHAIFYGGCVDLWMRI